MNPRQTKLGSLDALVVDGTHGGPCVILCHGFGANAFDLLPLASNVKARPGTTWIFPQASLSFTIGPGMQGRAWFPLVAEELARLVAAGKNVTFADVVPPGLAPARGQLEELIRSLDRSADLITVGGFSQGSMVATDVFLSAPNAFAGLVILSGTLIAREEWARKAPARRGSQFLQSHGTMDPVLPFDNARRLETLLRESGMSGEFISFAGGHEIPQGVLKKLGQYLTR